MEIEKSLRQPLNRVGLAREGIKALPANTIGGRLAKRRLALGLTQCEVASSVMIESKTGAHSGEARPLSRNAYAMYELDSVEPSLTTLKALAEALRVSPASLAFGVTKRSSGGRSRRGTRLSVVPPSGGGTILLPDLTHSTTQA